MPLRRSQSFADQRAGMVERQLRRRGIADERVLDVMAHVPRELFVPEPERRRAYNDSALPIGHGQTISQPWIVAAIAEALELAKSDRVLEIGTGSGYSAAVMGPLCREVITIERLEPLASDARAVLERLGLRNVRVIVADGTEGWPEEAPYDGIAVHATAPAAPPSLLDQLAPGGRLVIPVAGDGVDMLTAYRRTGEDLDPGTGGGLEKRNLGACRFVPLIGREGFDDGRSR
jgi:protein-L-isoaspartate(D-aspartate) O-methyltransferase